MPKKTFFNLQEAKRNKIIESALDEFSTYTFNSASINRIVEKAQIAKGSFYQYFEDKMDLYKYLLDQIVEHKMKYFPSIDTTNFFTYYKILFDLGTQFAEENPKYALLANFLYKDSALRTEILGEMEEKNHEYIKSLLQKGQENKDIRKDIDLDIVTLLLYHLNIMIAELHFNPPAYWQDATDFKSLSSKLIDIIENGIKDSPQGKTTNE